MRKSNLVRMILAATFLFSTCLTAQEKITGVVVKSKFIDLETAEMMSSKLIQSYQKTGDYITVPAELFYQNGFNKKILFSDNNIAKIGKMLKTDLITAIDFMQKDSSIVAMGRTISTTNAKPQKIIISEPMENVEEFTSSRLDGFIEKLTSENQESLPEGQFAFSANTPVKVYVDKKKVNPDLYLGKKFSAGHHKVAILKTDGSIIAKRTVFVNEGEVVNFNYMHTDQSKVLMKSLFLPGFGQFSNDRKITGGVIAGATIGAAAFLVMNILDHNSNLDSHDAALASFNSATTAASKESFRVEANNLQKDCDDSNTMIIASAGILGAVYLVNVLDALIFTEEDSFQISRVKKREKSFSYKPLMGVGNDRITAGLSFAW